MAEDKGTSKKGKGSKKTKTKAAPPELMAKKKKPAKPKQSKKEKLKAVVPEIVTSDTPFPISLTMDSTAALDFTIVRNKLYSKEIIEATNDAVDLNKLSELKKGNREDFLQESETQIFKLWHGIEALTIHNTMFVVLFLIQIGEILNGVKNTLTFSEYSKWKKIAFHGKHKRYFQQAQQLARMGAFAKRFAAIGKKRLLVFDRLRKELEMESCQEIYDENPLSDTMSELLLPAEISEDNPLPDMTEDLEGDILKEHIDGIVTLKRLRSAGINFASFDQAYLIAAYSGDTITVKMATKIKTWLDEKGTTRNKKKWFDLLVMNKMAAPDNSSTLSPAGISLNQALAYFVGYCQSSDFNDNDWMETQKVLLEEDLFRDAYKFIRQMKSKFGVRVKSKSASKRLAKGN